jgi:hypothetical protein
MSADENHCDLCGESIDLDLDDRPPPLDGVVCPAGHLNQEGALSCEECGLGMLAAEVCSNGHYVPPGQMGCPECGSTIRLELVAALDDRPAALDEPLDLTLDRCTVIGGSGVGLHLGEPCVVLFRPKVMKVVGQSSFVDVTAGYADITLLGLAGGEVTTGGGFIGGGFGIEGAVKGIAIASIANWLTTRTSVNTLIQVRHPEFEVFIHHGRFTPGDLRIMLSAAFQSIGDRPASS